MKKLLATAVALAVAAAVSTATLAHTNSIGYVGDGNGGLNFWYGSWHDGTTFNEAEIKIVKPDGTTSIDAFTLLSQDSPAGLISGVNFFGSDGTQLIPYDINAGGGESYTWQGINYQNLVTGQYTFVYIPLGDAESTICPQADYQAGTCNGPTADWDPMDQVIRSLTINLTTGDLTGDANNNGILDINEVAAGSASGGPVAPTVVSQGSSRVVGYVAVSGGVIQIVQRTQTDTTWDNMSDGTTQNVQTTSTALPDWSGRIDQIATGNQMLSVVNRGLNFNGVNSVGNMAKMNNGMSGGVSGVTVGGNKDLGNGLRIGGGAGKLSTRVRDNGSADVDSTLVNLHGSKEVTQGTVNFALTHSVNDYTTSRTIGDFVNAGVTNGTDTWVNVTFVGLGERVRPVFGVTRGVRGVNGYTETGDVQTARTVAKTTDWYTYGTIGAQATLKEGIIAQALHHSDGVNSLSIAVKKNLEKDAVLTAGVSRNMTRDGASTSINVGLVKKF